MADDPNPVLRKELLAALDVIDPQLRGLRDLVASSVSDELRASLNDQISVRQRRVDRIRDVLNNLDATLTARNALEDDGYPALLPGSILASQFAELKEEASDLVAAVGVFVEQASRVIVNVGAPADKPL